MYRGNLVWRIVIILLLVLSIIVALGMTARMFKDDEIEKITSQLLNDINRAYLARDEEMLLEYFDQETLYGKWAYEYALKKLNYMEQWSRKQGIDFVDLSSEYEFLEVNGSEDVFNVSVKSLDEYAYKYKGSKEINRYQIGVYHYMRIEMKEDRWVITKDWFSDPMSETMGIEVDDIREVTEYICNYNFPGCELSDRRRDAVKYADKYCGAVSGSSYNKEYRDYNSVGGDCANFASQVLYEGGKFGKNSVWNYHKGGSMAWIKAYNLTNYLLSSGRGSRIAVGSYLEVYKSAYKLQPGDIVAYEEKGDIKHVSVVTGYDSKGYPLVNCHNVDRYRVPWDIGWNRLGIKYWLVKVHY